MKILFITGDLLFSEPLGVMALSAICKARGHSTRLAAVMKHDIGRVLSEFEPDIVGYSAMSADVKLFRQADETVRAWATVRSKRVTRIMGGPHPTFFNQVLSEFDLDAICVGEGDNAITSIIDAVTQGRPIRDIPNVIGRGETLEGMRRELIHDLASYPYFDRQLFYDAVPYYRWFRIRSVLTSRGCPYHCTYCHNPALHEIFRGCGSIVRRYPVGHVIDELKYAISQYSPATFIRFGDDVFANTIDGWLKEFLARYREEIRLPFYCLMRSNALTAEMAKLLADHGCVSISMSLESGIESVRNGLLKRNLPDGLVIESYRAARGHRLRVQGNTMLALPGGTFDDDYRSFLFARKLRMALPTFGIFTPYPRTELADQAIDKGLIPRDYDFGASFLLDRSVLTSYTDKERDMQLNISQLGTIFCDLPSIFLPLFRWLIRRKPNALYRLVGRTYMILKFGLRIFPQAIVKNPWVLFKTYIDSIKYLFPDALRSSKK